MLAPVRPVRGSTTLTNLRWCVWWAVLALVCAESLGLMHQVVHDRRAGAELHGEHFHRAGPGQANHEHSHEDASRASEGHGERHWLKALFDQHEDATDCRLYDGLGPHELACPGAVALPVLLSGALQHLVPGPDFVARWPALYDARGPPRSR